MVCVASDALSLEGFGENPRARSTIMQRRSKGTGSPEDAARYGRNRIHHDIRLPSQ